MMVLVMSNTMLPYMLQHLRYWLNKTNLLSSMATLDPLDSLRVSTVSGTALLYEYSET